MEIRYFQFVNGTLSQQNQQVVTGTLTGLAQTGETVWLLESAAMAAYRWGAPFTLESIETGVVSIYEAGSFITLTPGVEQIPSAVAWGVSGTVWATSTANELYQISVSGAAFTQAAIPPYDDQITGVPLGISSLVWWADGHLYGGSAFNGLLAQLV